MTAVNALNLVWESSGGDEWVSQNRRAVYNSSFSTLVQIRPQGGIHDVATSLDNGVTWTTSILRPDGYTDAWSSIEWIAELGEFLVVNSDYAGWFARSADGLAWVCTETGPPYAEGICYAENLSRLVTCGYGFYSSDDDGDTWVLRHTAGDFQYMAVCYSPELGLFVSVNSSNSATLTVAVSADGIDWIEHGGLPPSGWASVVWEPTLELFVASASAGGAATSLDGTTWTERALPFVGLFPGNNLLWIPEIPAFVLPGGGPGGDVTYQTTFASNNGADWEIVPETVGGAKTARSGFMVWNPSIMRLLAWDETDGRTYYGDLGLPDGPSANFWTDLIGVKEGGS